MTDILVTLFFILIAIAVLSSIYFISARIKLVRILSKLKKLSGVSLEINLFSALFSRNMKSTPFASLKCRNKTYLIRIFNGKSSFKSVHIANERYAVVFSKSGGGGMKHVGGRSRLLRAVREPFRIHRAITKIIPKIDPVYTESKKPLPNDYDTRYYSDVLPEQKIIPTIIFCPAPQELTFVTEERSSIKVAFTGDTVFGQRVFTPETFAKYIDRDSRGFFD